MTERDLLVLGSDEVGDLLAGREAEVIDAVAEAYTLHGRGESSLPHSAFLRFPGNGRDRIIALPAYLGGGFDMAGVKWIASFPGNAGHGLPRASAVMILNSCETGRPTALLEASSISAWRTAASAALAASRLATPGAEIGLVGTGPINFEVLRFVRVALPGRDRVVVYDLDPARAEAFASRAAEAWPDLGIRAAPDVASVLAGSSLVSFATTASEPHVGDLSGCGAGSTILHVSLRDLSVEAILESDNVVDDADHVCRASTSLHLAEQAVGDRRFIRCTLADVLAGTAPARRSAGGVTVFSPFGLGVLDLAVARMAFARAVEAGRGIRLPAFLPAAAGTA